MRREDLDAARAKLQKRRREIVELIRRGDAGMAQIRSEREIEFGDEAQAEQEQERIARIEAVEDAEVSRIDAALARIDAGTYGTCSSCGEPIDRRRLDAYPDAAQCADCAELASAPARR